MPGTSAVVRTLPLPAVASVALFVFAALAPAVAAGAVALATSATGDTRLFRVDAAGIIASVAVAAFASRRRSVVVAYTLAPVAVAIVHAIVQGGVDGAGSVAAIAAAAALAAAGLASLGRAFACPRAAAGAFAATALWIACGGVWWADRAAAEFPPERRAEIRAAVLRADPLSAASYGAAGHDRLRSPDVYEETIVGSSAIRPPDALETAGVWGALGGLALGLAALLARVTGRIENEPTEPDAARVTSHSVVPVASSEGRSEPRASHGAP